MEGQEHDDHFEEVKHSDIITNQKQESPGSNIKN